jgi:hypothetical protein
MKILNKYEKLIVFAYAEKFGPSPKTLCEIPDLPEANEQTKEEQCFGLNRDWIEYGIDGYEDKEKDIKIEGIRYQSGGRTPLWQAMKEVYAYMKKQNVEHKHIVVINDGPDTCSSKSRNYISTSEGPCSTTSYEDFVNMLQTEGDPSIHVHFIQFQAKGYRDQDPAQAEVACMTNGNYIFINSNDLPVEDQGLYQALNLSVYKIRYAFAGMWRLGIDLPVISGDFAPPDGLRPGNAYAPAGTVTLLASDFTSTPKTTQLGVGTATPAHNPTPSYFVNLDDRPAFVKACLLDSDCNYVPDQICRKKKCYPEGNTCGYEIVPDATPCSGGVCCKGACQSGNDCV